MSADEREDRTRPETEAQSRKTEGGGVPRSIEQWSDPVSQGSSSSERGGHHDRDGQPNHAAPDEPGPPRQPRPVDRCRHGSSNNEAGEQHDYADSSRTKNEDDDQQDEKDGQICEGGQVDSGQGQSTKGEYNQRTRLRDWTSSSIGQ
jgi:hypothetical protein